MRDWAWQIWRRWTDRESLSTGNNTLWVVMSPILSTAKARRKKEDKSIVGLGKVVVVVVAQINRHPSPNQDQAPRASNPLLDIAGTRYSLKVQGSTSCGLRKVHWKLYIVPLAILEAFWRRLYWTNQDQEHQTKAVHLAKIPISASGQGLKLKLLVQTKL